MFDLLVEALEWIRGVEAGTVLDREVTVRQDIFGRVFEQRSLPAGSGGVDRQRLSGAA